MSGSATSTLDIVLKDDVSAAAKAVAASLEKVQAEAKSVDEALAKSGTRNGLQDRLKSLGASKAQIEGVARAYADFAKAEGIAMGEAGKWTAKQAAQVKNWENVTVASLRAVRGEERAREYAEIAGAKRIADAQEKAHKRRMEQAAQEAAAQARQHERMVERQEHGEAHHGVRNYLLQSAALAVSAHAIMSTIEGVVEHGAEYQHKLVALQNAGRTPEEIAEMQRASHATIAAAPTARLSENLEILNETVGAFGSVEHALDHLTFMNKASAVLHATAGGKITESAGEMGNALAKFFEMRGTAGNSAVFEREAGEMMKSMVFSGGNVNPRELLLFGQQAKSALQNYDIQFLSRVAPSLIGEVGGERAGTQANAFAGTILGKARDAKQTEAWIKYGLLDPSQTIKGSKGPTGWNAGAIYHTDEFLSNPLEAIKKYVLPALAAKGVDVSNKLELTKALGTMFRNTMANAFANELAQAGNIQRLDKDAGLIGQVDDYDTIYKRLLATDPTVAFKALTGSLENLMTTVSAPAMGTAARFLSEMAGGLNGLATAAHDNPGVALTTGLAAAAGALALAGTLSYKLLNGFGNATFGPAAGEMAAAGHEQLAAGRMMVTAAEAMRVAAVEHDIPAVVPGGKVAGTVVREGEVLAEGAAEAAIGSKIVGAVETGLKGGLSVGALEVAAAAGVTLTAGTVTLLGLSAAAIIAGLKASTEPKHQAAKDPGFGNPFAPNAPIDYSDPKYRDPDSLSDEEKKDAAKSWFNRGKGTPRGALPAYRDTDKPGHWVQGPHGEMHWALEDHDRILKHAPFFSTAPLGPDGRLSVPMPPLGLWPDRDDKRTWAHIDGSLPLPQPGLYQPADVPLPPVVPPRPAGVEVPPPATPLPRDSARYPVVPEPVPASAPPLAPPPAPTAPAPPPPVDHSLDGFVMGQLTPKVDTSGIEAASAKATEAGATMQTALNVTATPQVQTASIDAAIGKAQQLIGILGQVGPAAASAGAAVAAIGGGGAGARPGPSLASRARGTFDGTAPGHSVG